MVSLTLATELLNQFACANKSDNLPYYIQVKTLPLIVGIGHYSRPELSNESSVKVQSQVYAYSLLF